MLNTKTTIKVPVKKSVRGSDRIRPQKPNTGSQSSNNNSKKENK